MKLKRIESYIPKGDRFTQASVIFIFFELSIIPTIRSKTHRLIAPHASCSHVARSILGEYKSHVER